jgi:uncharacterized protein
MRDDVKDQGYDREDEYFHRKNKELLEKRRAELDAQRAEQQASELKERHWMRCPKCGHEMAEETMEEIKVDRCSHCLGIYFDAGELELLLESREETGLLAGMKRWLKR